MRLCRLISGLSILVVQLALAANAPFTARDLTQIQRLESLTFSAGGNGLAFVVKTLDKDEAKYTGQIYTIDADGTNLKQVTRAKQGSVAPAWSPDGKRLAYVYDDQIWIMDKNGKNAKQLTRLSTGADAPVWSPDGKMIAFTSAVFANCKTDSCNKDRLEKNAESRVKAHVATRLLFRHWNAYTDQRTHVFVIATLGTSPRDITPGDFDAPPYGAQSGIDYRFSPDSKSLVFLRNPDPIEAVSTNSDIYWVSLQEGAPSKNLTQGMKGYDIAPQFSPDGTQLFFLSQQTPGFESDRFRLMRYSLDNGHIIELTRDFTLSVLTYTLSPSGDKAYFTAYDAGYTSVFSVSTRFELAGAANIKKIATLGEATSLQMAPNGNDLFLLNSTYTSPAEIYKLQVPTGSLTPMTQFNKAFLQRFNLPKEASIQWQGAQKAMVQGFLFKPANFTEGKKYPLVVLVHGGPQVPWTNSWSYRWNPQLYTNQGYAVFMPNFRGSPGLGQKFVDEISKDWGGKAYIDTMNGVAEVAKAPFVDPTRIGAAGGSYGGWMINWMLGHNNDPRVKFRAFFNHAGIFDSSSMAAETDELWFVNWEFGGMPWDKGSVYSQWSPSKYVKRFATPTLVSCGELDYRVPYTQSVGLFTALQLQRVPSKLIIFPDEGHFISKPYNLIFWYDQIFDWFKSYLG